MREGLLFVVMVDVTPGARTAWTCALSGGGPKSLSVFSLPCGGNSNSLPRAYMLYSVLGPGICVSDIRRRSHGEQVNDGRDR